MSEYKRSRQLLEQFKNQKDREKAEELLRLLPQGPGSGLDADTVDKMHAEEIIEETLARIGIRAKRGPAFGGGGGGMQKHGNEWHDPAFEEYGLSLLLDGSRDMTENLNMGSHSIENTTILSAARAYLSASQTINSGIWTSINLNVVDFDYNTEFDTTTHKFTAKQAGLYSVVGFMHFKNTQVVADKICGVMVKKNNVSIGETLVHTASADYAASSFGTLVELDVDDYIDLWVYHNFGAAKQVTGGPTGQYTHLALSKFV